MIGINGIPSHKYSTLPDQRIVAVCMSTPIMLIRMPKQATVTPRNGALPEREATMAIPRVVIAKSSGVPTAKTSGLTIGMVNARTTAPNSPPISEAV